MKKKSGILLTVFMALLLLGIGACTPGEAEVLEGILENVDSVNGEITIVTKDGRRITLEIETDTTVEADGTASDLETLEVGVSIEVEVDDDGKAAKHIEARQAKVEGNIIEINGNEITVQSERGGQVTVTIGDSTRVEFNDDYDIIGTGASLRIGDEVEIKYDPESLVALKIEIEESDDKEDGIVTASGLNWGIIEIRVTDPPPADIKSAVVWLTNIEVHRASGDSGDSDDASGWIMVLDSPSSFDLMEVIGVVEILGSANLTAGRYTQIRMDVTEVTGETTDGEPYTAEVPGGKLRIVRSFTIGDGDTTILTLDFDGEKSLIRTGNDRFIFKPVVKLSIDKAEKGEKGTGQGEGEEDEDEEDEEDEEDGQNNNELELEGVIVSIDGDIWTVTADNVTTTVDVSGVEIEGEPAEGSQIKVTGIMENDVLIASEVEIKEPEED